MLLVLFPISVFSWSISDIKPIDPPPRSIPDEYIYSRVFDIYGLYDMINTYRLIHDVQVLWINSTTINVAADELLKYYQNQQYVSNREDYTVLFFKKEVSEAESFDHVEELLEHIICTNRTPKVPYPNHLTGPIKPYEIIVWATLHMIGIDCLTIVKDGKITVYWSIVLDKYAPGYTTSYERRKNLNSCPRSNECSPWNE
ncbi:hypothetical protein GJ496_003131 [Pomphorhynchus laevis]|nr:hypothetical protein GJ496_003131 [Pomphorhynchus laevis]